MKQKKLLAMMALVLVACSDEVETVRVTEHYALDMLEMGVSLTEELCDSERMGQLLYVGDSSSIYYCTGKVWKKLNGDDGRDGRDGEDGVDGKDGKRGEYGTSGTECYIDKFTDGFTLGCGATKAVVRYNFEIPDSCSIELQEDSSYVLRCGKDQAVLSQGTLGEAGDLCTQKDVGGGQVRLVCGQDSVTLFRAVCGEIPFDPDGPQFCFGDTLVPRCGTQAYNIKKAFCLDGKVIPFCKGKRFNPDESFCYNDSLVYLCGGEEYNPEKEFCYRGPLAQDCPSDDFDLYYDTCMPSYDMHEGKVVPKCGGKMYDPTLQYCVNGTRFAKCAGVEYYFDVEDCYEGTIVPRCFGKLDKDEFCDKRNGKVYRFTVIGKMTWMSQNLDYKVPNSYCDTVFKDEGHHCGINGRFYPWTVAMQLSDYECGEGRSCGEMIEYPHQGVCPNGWHIPQKSEWVALVEIMGDNDHVYWDKSVDLFERDGAYAEDPYGFSALPTGVVDVSWRAGKYTRIGDYTKWPEGFDTWSSTEAGADKAELIFFYANYSYYGKVDLSHPFSKASTRTIRCVKD